MPSRRPSPGPPEAWERRFREPLPTGFYDRPTRSVARALLGTVLLRRDPGGLRAARIVETEAYVARDPASHAYRGPTPRNASMFAGPGTLYVYRIHQVHCANIATRPGEAVLLRAAEPLPPWEAATRGPGRLCRALGLDRSLDGSSVVRGPVRLVAGPRRPEGIVTGPRVGIRRAEAWPLRFALRGNPYVSAPRPWPGGRARGPPRARRST